MALLFFALFFVSTFAKPYEQLWTQDVQGQLIPTGTKMSMHEQGASLVTDLSNFVNTWLAQKGIPHRPPPTLQSKNPYPYFAFIPFYMGSVIPDGDPLTWESRCFRSVSLEAKTVATNTYNLTFTFKMHVDPLCSDFYWIATITAGEFPSFNQAGQTVIQWTVPDNTSSAGLYDVQKAGFRVLMFAGNEEQTALDVADTVAMLEAFFLPTVPQECADRNLYFLENYAGVKMANRSSGVVNIDESLIQDGDFFGVLRLDGVDPMLAWAMGSTTGHTATALRFNGTLHVCESTTLDAYWPVNGIQCTEYQQWVNQTNYANMNIVWSPLSSTYAAMYDAEAAYNFFTTVQGLDYGWYNLLYGWIDTLADNYPCIPPYPSKQCLTWEVAEVLMGAFQRVDPPFVEEIFDQAMNLRLGTSGLDVPGILQEADIQGIPRDQLPVIVESDQFVYNTTRYGAPAQGLSMVCCVFVCEMWKHGGLFNGVNDEINCAEFTNWDDYTLAIFSKNPRPQVCVDADPDNQCCQIEGDYELNLNNYNSKSEYAHMAENCPSEAPDYQKPANC